MTAPPPASPAGAFQESAVPQEAPATNCPFARLEFMEHNKEGHPENAAELYKEALNLIEPFFEIGELSAAVRAFSEAQRWLHAKNWHNIGGASFITGPELNLLAHYKEAILIHSCKFLKGFAEQKNTTPKHAESAVNLARTLTERAVSLEIPFWQIITPIMMTSQKLAFTGYEADAKILNARLVRLAYSLPGKSEPRPSQ